jgi:hypothetical protein
MRSNANDGEGNIFSTAVDTVSHTKSELKDELISILGEHMPLDSSSEFAFCLPGFMSLRLLLLKSNTTVEEDDMITTILNSFVSFRTSSLSDGEIAVMLTRDFLYLKQIQHRFEPQNTAASVLQQWSSNSSIPLSSVAHSLFHTPLDGSITNYQMSNNTMVSADQNRIPSIYNSFRTESDNNGIKK